MIVILVTLLAVLMTIRPALGETIKIGVSIALTGPMSREGHLVKEGYEFWRDHVNEQGGFVVGGKRHTIHIVFYDDESDAQTSARLTERLIADDKVQFLLGPFSSLITMETSLTGEKRRILTVAPQANADAVYERRFKYVVSVLPPASSYMKLFLEMATKLTPRPRTVPSWPSGSRSESWPPTAPVTMQSG